MGLYHSFEISCSLLTVQDIIKDFKLGTDYQKSLNLRKHLKIKAPILESIANIARTPHNTASTRRKQVIWGVAYFVKAGYWGKHGGWRWMAPVKRRAYTVVHPFLRAGQHLYVFITHICRCIISVRLNDLASISWNILCFLRSLDIEWQSYIFKTIKKITEYHTRSI